MQRAQMTEGSEEKEGAGKDRSVKLRLHGGDEEARRAREALRQVSQTAMRAASISRCGPHYLSRLAARNAGQSLDLVALKLPRS